MALAYADRVQETSTTTGTGTYSLGGATTAHQTFVAGIGNTNTCYYMATDGTDWEVGLGTVTDAAPDTLARTSILASTNADAAVNWSAGTKYISCVLPAGIIAVLARLNTAQTWSADQTFAGALDTVYTVSGTTPAIDGSNGGIQVWTLTGNSTPTDSMANGETILLMIDDGTAYTVTWTSLVDVWLTDSGSAPTLKTTGYTNVVLTKQGGNVYGFRSGDGG